MVSVLWLIADVALVDYLRLVVMKMMMRRLVLLEDDFYLQVLFQFDFVFVLDVRQHLLYVLHVDLDAF